MLHANLSTIFLLEIKEIQPKAQVFLCHERMDGLGSTLDSCFLYSPDLSYMEDMATGYHCVTFCNILRDGLFP